MQRNFIVAIRTQMRQLHTINIKIYRDTTKNCKIRLRQKHLLAKIRT